MLELWLRLAPISQVAIGAVALVVMCILVLFAFMFFQDPLGSVKSAWLWALTYQKKLELAADGESDDSLVRLARFQQTWSVSNLTRMIVIAAVAGTVNTCLNIWFNGYKLCFTGFFVFGVQFAVTFIASLLVHTILGLFSPRLAYTSKSSWSDVFWFSHNGEVKKKETCVTFGALLAIAVLIPLAIHFVDWTVFIAGVLVAIGLAELLYKNYRRCKIRMESDAIRFEAERKGTADILAGANEAIRTSNELLAAGEMVTAEMQEQIRSSTELLASNAEKEAKRVAKKAEEDAKKLAGYQPLVDERDFLLMERNRLIEKVDALFAERKKFALKDARDLVRAKVLIEASKGEVVSPKLMEARSLIIGVLYQSPLEQTEKDSIELAVCRDLGHVPVKK